MELETSKELRPKIFTSDQEEEIVKHLDEEGYVVIKDYIPKSLCNKLVDDVFDYFEKADLGFDVDDKKTWKTSNLPTEGLGATQFNSGFYGIYHLPAQDEIRFSDNAEKIWKLIWSHKLQKEKKEIELWTAYHR